MNRFLLSFCLVLICLCSHASVVDSVAVKKVYVFHIREEIMPSTVRLTAKCMDQAIAGGYDYVVIDMNTYGGFLESADSIRSRILQSPIPIYVFINNQAASAGALIAIAADRIYMREGGSIGAATVVDQQGDVLPDKYQSFMRSMMRSTAESHGKRAEVTGTDTVWHWVRDPEIAEAMVDPTIVIAGLSSYGKVVTFTTDEAILWDYCEGKVSSVEQLLDKAGVGEYRLDEYDATWLDVLIGFLTNPVIQGIFIMFIIGGIYFELQTPGIGFPLIVAIVGALLYFSPLFIEGMVEYWEILLFIVGVILILLEIFIIPGFGIAGVAGIAAVILGLSLAMIDTSLFKYVPTGEISIMFFVKPLSVVVVSTFLAFVLCFWLGSRFLIGNSPLKHRVVLTTEMTTQDGYVARVAGRDLVGSKARTTTALRPAGKIMIGSEHYQASSEDGLFIEQGAEVDVVRDDNGILYCRSMD